MADGLTELDFFRDPQLVEDPYPYFEALRSGCPVHRNGPHGVTMVTGWDEAVQVYNDADTFSSVTSVTGPFPGFPVPLEGLTKDEVNASSRSTATSFRSAISCRRWTHRPTPITVRCSCV